MTSAECVKKRYFCGNMSRRIELLAPARNLDCGLEAIKHGADAVYIGGPAFGARAAVGNSLEDIRRLCSFAHIYDARVYVTLNTILYDSELAQAEQLVWQLYDAEVDALIVQDFSLLRLSLPPFPLHASTQTDNRTPEKAAWLENLGFSQIVLARELSIDQIKTIDEAVTVPLEAFVHGALCVSYSGRCYASQYCFGRSANRGACAQFCRLAFDLVDGTGRTLIHDKHLLSLRDMCRADHLEEMIDAGVSSFKIEGRLKDMAYVKNVTAYYRKRLDQIIARRADLVRSSSGSSVLTFEPSLTKTFNRGFTSYLLHGRTEPIHNADTPKSMGEPIGRVERCDGNSITVSHLAADAELHAGDGLTFFDEADKLQGFRINRADGRTAYPFKRTSIARGTQLFRNLDSHFERLMAGKTAVRQLRLNLRLSEVADGFLIEAKDESGRHCAMRFKHEAPPAQKPQKAQIEATLSRLGDTPFAIGEISIETEAFIPKSVLAQWRREIIDLLMRTHRQTFERRQRRTGKAARPAPLARADYSENISNRLAAEVYTDCGVEVGERAFELEQPHQAVLMTCRHCLRHALGACPRQKVRKRELREPLSLRLPDGRSFPLRFDCRACEMQVLAPK